MNYAKNLKLWPIERLKPYERNARTHSEEQVSQIAASITEFGFTNPILVDGSDGVIAGHGRLEAAKRLGLKEVPVIELTYLSPKQKQAYIIADNKLALNAGWDDAILSKELAELSDSDFDLSLIGFSDEELKSLLPDSFEDETQEYGDEENTPEPPKNPKTVIGDVWILGSHRLMCGDSTNIDHAKLLTNNALMDLLLTDPPYNVSYTGKTSDALTIQNDSMSNEKFRQFLRDVYATADAFLKPGGGFYIWHADSEGYNFRGAAFDIGWSIRQCLIWNKNSLVLGRQDYHWKHEPCLYGWKEGAAHYWGSDRKQTTVLNFDKPQRNGEHPTMKPVALFEYQIENSCPPKGCVIDLFGGSGTTLIASEKLGRKSFLMELDPKYCDVIIKRWQEFTGNKAIHEKTGKTYDEIDNG